MNADQGPDIWVPEIRQDKVELVNVDTGERQYEPDVAVLVPPVERWQMAA